MTVTREARIEAIKVLIAEGWNPPLPSERVVDKLARTMDSFRPEVDLPTESSTRCLYLAAEGYSIKETAELLGLSPYTVMDHRKHYIRRLGARNTTHAVVIALRRGLLAA
jgi:DNA-binding CsgD family transcriptional regulator